GPCRYFHAHILCQQILRNDGGRQENGNHAIVAPVGLVMVIIWWGTFTRVLAYPTDIVAAKTESLFDSGQIEVNNLRLQRAKLMVDVADQLTTIQAETEIAEKEADT